MKTDQTATKYKRYDAAFKHSAVEHRMLSGKSAGIIAGELGIKEHSLHKWKQQFKALPAGQVVGALEKQDQFLELFHRVAGSIAGVGLFITGLALFVSGIGIRNIMFVSIAKRTREVGIRRALGAKKRNIWCNSS